MSTEYSWHTIAVGNRVLGLYNFLVLVAPPRWRIVIMPMASEVFKHREVNGAKWVRDGEVMHFVYDGSEAYVLKITVRPGRKKMEGRPIIVNGHEGYYKTEEKNGRVRVEMAFYCDVTDRTVKIRLEDLKDLDVLNYIGMSKCH